MLGLQPVAPVVRTNAVLATARALLTENRQIPGMRDRVRTWRLRFAFKSRCCVQFHSVLLHVD
jgi:hypothetical protein